MCVFYIWLNAFSSLFVDARVLAISAIFYWHLQLDPVIADTNKFLDKISLKIYKFDLILFNFHRHIGAIIFYWRVAHNMGNTFDPVGGTLFVS